MARINKKRAAQYLRAQGLSIRTIVSRLGIPKSTASLWCRTVPLKANQRQHLQLRRVLGGARGRLKAAEVNKKNRARRIEEEYERARILLGNLSPRDQFMVGIGLYWGEGTKTDTSTTSFINSDPLAIKFMIAWFSDHFGVTTDGFNPYISIIESHKDRENTIKQYWSEQTGLPLELFRKVIYLKTQHKRVYENRDLYYGTLALRIRKSTHLKYRIRGLLKKLSRT